MIVDLTPLGPRHGPSGVMARFGRISWLGRLPIYLLCTFVAVVFNYLLGKDMPWDTLDYHLYAGFSAVSDRFAQDYFAAGPQSYFNPYAYIPFYELVRAGLPAVIISSVLAIVHSLLLWLTYELALLVSPPGHRSAAQRIGLLAVIFAFVNPVLLEQIGSSFDDITTAILVLGGWVLLIAASRAPRPWRIVCAGLILGVASALKLTNSIYAIAAYVLVAMIPLRIGRKAGYLAGFGAATGLGFAIVAMPWALRLEKMFGNPFFPLFNQLFRSPDFTTEPLRHYRFLPDSLTEALWRPFAMADPVNLVHIEFSAPDIRYAVLIVLIFLFALGWALRQFRRMRGPTRPMRLDIAAMDRSLVALGSGFVLAWILWLTTSANSRYFLPMASVASVLIAAFLHRLFSSRPKVFGYVIATLVSLQAIQLWFGAEYRWNATPWGGPWLDISVPTPLRTEPNLYLTVGIQSNSFIAPFLAPGSGLVNFSGGYALGPDGPGGDRVVALIARYAPNLRVLVAGSRLYPDTGVHMPNREGLDGVLERFRLRIDPSDCQAISVHGVPDEVKIVFRSVKVAPNETPGTMYLLSCRVVPSNVDQSPILARQREVDLVLNRVEDACPKLFQPKRPLTEHAGSRWMRLYVNTDLKVWVSKGWVKFVDAIRGDDAVYIGRESDWMHAPLRLACGRHDRHYFAKVINSNPGS